MSWNSTAPVKDKPILLYLFDSSAKKGDNFDEAKTYEIKVFPNRKVTKLSEKFICEKLCFKNELGRTYKGREMLAAYKKKLQKIPLKKRKVDLVFLSSDGEVLLELKKARTASKVAKAMSLALKKQKKLLAQKARDAKAAAAKTAVAKSAIAEAGAKK